MKELQIQTSVKVYSYDELEPEMASLVDTAKKMTQNAYCPYSGFRVGAAALLANGQVVTGANQENAAYPSGMCAERVTLFAANANHPDTPVVALALACFTNGHFTHEVSSPCGACRQVMLETEHRYGRPMKVILYCEEGCYVVDSVSELLPLSFVAKNLEREIKG